MAAETICSYFKFGFCKHGNFCRRRHINEKCESPGCDGIKCNKRHPQFCKYFGKYRRCKFGEYCAFDHAVPIDPVLEELEEIKAKLVAVEKEIDSKNSEILILVAKIENDVNSLKCVLPSYTDPVTKSPSNIRSILTVINPSNNTMCKAQSDTSGDQLPQLDGPQEVLVEPPPSLDSQQKQCLQWDNYGKAFDTETQVSAKKVTAEAETDDDDSDAVDVCKYCANMFFTRDEYIEHLRENHLQAMISEQPQYYSFFASP